MIDRLIETLVEGLRQHSITKCSEWAQQYRIMGTPYPGPFSFKYHPWSREIHDCDAPMVVSKKAAQMGITECALNKTFFTIDKEQSSVLYILPASKPDAADFSSSRFDPALDLSEHLKNLFSDVKNTGHKRAGNANLFIRGSRSRSQMKSLPVSLLIGDEVDEMNIENLKLAFERLSGQIKKQIFLLSTPSIYGKGISEFYEQTTQEEFFFRCPHCNRLINLLFPRNLQIVGDDPNSREIYKSYLFCHECNGVLPHETKYEYLQSGIWVAAKEDKINRGFSVSQLYSSVIPPHMIATDFFKAQTNPTDEQEFYNNKLGLEHEVEGSRITDEQIVECTRDYKMLDSMRDGSLITMGVDIGKFIHYTIVQWFLHKNENDPDINLNSIGKIIKVGKVVNFTELDALMRTYRVTYCVVDKQPETRLAMQFARRFFGRVRCCHYTVGLTSRQLVDKTEALTVSVDRTMWLDITLSRYKVGSIIIPKDIPTEFKEHIKTLVRMYKKDNLGNVVGYYTKKDNDADHYAHAMNYAEIALGMCSAHYGVKEMTDAY